MVATVVARKQQSMYLMHKFVVPKFCCAGSQRRAHSIQSLNHGHRSSCPLRVLYFCNELSCVTTGTMSKDHDDFNFHNKINK